MSNKEAINKMADHNNYLHVEFKEIPIKSTDVLRWQDGRKWMVVANGEEVEFNPLYHIVYPGESSPYCIDDTKYEESTAEIDDDHEEDNTPEETHDATEKELKDLDEDHASYDANTLGCITASAIAEEDKKLDSVIRNIIDECIKAAKKCETEARVVIDLGGTSNYIANNKAKRISRILAERGFEVSYHNGTGNYEYDRHVFNIQWSAIEGSHPVNHCY